MTFLTKVFIFEPENDIGIGMIIFFVFLHILTMLYLGPKVSVCGVNLHNDM